MKRLLILLTALVLGGCAQPGKSYYVLTSGGPVPTGGGTGIGVGPVSLAEYLDRPNLVTQETANQLGVAEDHRWAGDLTENITRVTAADLGRLLNTGNVRSYPWQKDSEIRYQVTLDVRQLHSGADGYAVCEIGWRAYSLPERTLKASKTFSDREALESDGYDASVAAQSRLLQRLSESIAASLR
ncbi:membrane integrity-associated transporter subunit PqiC [Luteolibacter yonseiensis]|uniref:Membrane integrity-associated transporter subunit PqiC n=1 Tax=Luteolibacter yonseiensis TaxID=1144680 RepID=A0A934R2Y1_9BACT|nr:PqiC family protein [Luteolibacter yonseiensis]MBK1815847.1 membrane integrity-associated transporter subunit PqiC [Luteolibacter yonseiensis]